MENRRLSVLRVIKRSEVQISPLADKDKKPDNGRKDEMNEAGNGKNKRRKSRVSFGMIETTMFQKDSEWTNSPSPTHQQEFVSRTGTGNLSTLPDDSGYVEGSPAGSVAMDLTNVHTTRQQGDRLSLLPGLGDMQNQEEMASFCEDGAGGRSPGGNMGAAPMSLADLVAHDEQQWNFRAQGNSFDNSELLITDEGGIAASSSSSKLRAASAAAAAATAAAALAPAPNRYSTHRADITDHDLTADIPMPGNRTRALADHTGAFMEVTQAFRKNGNDGDADMDFTSVYGGIVSSNRVTTTIHNKTSRVSEAGMDLTTAYGGIVSSNHLTSTNFNKTSRVSEVGMDLTTAYGGIVSSNAVNGRTQTQAMMEFAQRDDGVAFRDDGMVDGADAMQELTGTLYRIKSGKQAQREPEQTETVAMEMTVRVCVYVCVYVC
jgi:hypothetical protein